MALNSADVELLASLNLQSSEAEILKAIKILQKNIQGNEQAQIKLNTDIDTSVVQNVLKQLQKMLNREDLSVNTKDSINSIQKEASAMMDVVKSANKASHEKIEFAKANKQVERSVEDTAEAINREHQAMDNLDDLNYILRNVNASGTAGNSVFQTFGNTLNQAFQTYTTANLLTDAIRKTVDSGKEAVEMVKEWDDAATSLRMATGASKNAVADYMDSYNQLGQELGEITGATAEAADSYLRQGHSIADTNELIKDSLILSHIANLDAADSTDYLTAIMNAYKLEAQEVLSVVDKLSQVDLNAAVDAGGIAEAMSKTATSAQQVGITIDQLIGMVSTVGEVTQAGMSEVGNSVRTIFSRMRDIKDGNLTSIGENGEITTLSNIEGVLKSVGIELRENNNEFRNFYDVLDETAEKWKYLTSVQKAAVTETYSGVRQSEKFNVLMENWDKVKEYEAISENSVGTATEKFQAYLDSLEAKTNSLKASLEALATATISDELYASVLDTSKAVVDLTADTGILKGLLMGLGASGAIYTFQQLTSYLGDATQGFANLNEAMSMTRSGAVGINDMQRLIDLTGGLSQSQTRLLLSTSNLTDAQKISILMNQKMSQAEAENAIRVWGLASAQQGATTATVTLNGVLRGLWTTLMANPLVLVTTAVTAGVTAFNAYKNHLEEVRQATADAATAYKDSASSIDEYVSKYQDLREALIAAKGNEEETATVKQQLLDLQTELNDAYGDEYGKLNLVTDAYKDQTEAIKALNKEEANRFLNENRKGISTATDQMTKERDYVLSAPTLSVDTPDGQELQKIVDSYADEGMRLISDSTTGAVQIVLEADAETAYETLNNFETDLRNKAKELGNENLFDGILDFSSNALEDAKSVVEEYGDIYTQALTAKLVTDDSASDVYGRAIDAVEAYNNAVLESEDLFNDEKVAEAKANVEAVKAEFANNEELTQFSTLFNNVFDQADTKLIDFHNKLKTDTSLQDWAEQLRGKDIVDLESMVDDGIDDAFDSLVESAEEYGLAVKDVIDALIRLGYVQGEVASSEETVGYNTVDLDTLNDQIDSIKSAYKGLTTTVEEYNQYGYITADTLQTLLNLDGQYLSCLINENGQLAINRDTYQALVQAKLADAEATAVQQTIEELGKVTTEQQISADVASIGVMAQKGSALAALTGQYAALANVAVSAAQAQALADAYTSASNINQAEADRIMSNLNAKLALIQNTATSTSGSFGALTNHLNGFEDASGKAKDATDELTESLKKQKSVLEDTKNEYDELYDAVQWFYENKQDAIDDKIDDLKELNEQLEKQKDNLDDVMSAMNLVYDSEIKALEAKRDALDDANEAAELELRIEQAKQKLREAQSRKNVLQYSKGKGFEYVVNQSAIKDAESELDEANAEKVKQSIQDQIDLIQSYKDRLSEIPKAYEQAMQKVAALKYLGADWQTAILNPSEDLFANLEADYTGIQGNIASNDSKIDSLEAKKKRIQELMDLWEDAKNQYKYQNYEAKLASFFGSDYEYQLLHSSATWRKKSATEYADVCRQIEEVENQIKALSEETTSSVTSNAERATTALKGTKDTLEGMKSVSSYIWTDQDDLALAFAEQRLSILNQKVAEGATELTTARDKVQGFVNEYSNLEQSGIVTDELKNKIQGLNDVSEYTGVYFGNMIAGVSDRLADMSNYTDKVVTDTQLTADSMNALDTAMQSVKVSETAVEAEVDTTATGLDTTVTDILTKIETLKVSLTELTTFRQTLEATMNQEILDSATVITDSQTKIEEIKTSMNSLLEVIIMLETSLMNLTTQMSTLDAVSLQNLISQIGLSAEEDAASGLLGALKNVLLLLNGEQTGLLYLLQTLNNTPLDTLIAEFNGEEASLLTSINQVKAAIYTEDGECLISTISKIAETISNIELVTNAFSTMQTQVSGCVEQVNTLKAAIDALEDKTITITTVMKGTDIPGFAKGTRKAPRGTAIVAEEGPEIISNGERVAIAEQPTLINLEGGETIYPADTTEDIMQEVLTDDGLKMMPLKELDNLKMVGSLYSDKIIEPKVLDAIMNGFSFNMNPTDVVPKFVQNVKNMPEKPTEQKVEINIGDIHLHEVQNMDRFAKEMKHRLSGIVAQEINRRS